MPALTLTLAAVSLNDQALSQPITAVFDARGGTIGRADHNTMALPDPQRHVSRLQAEVVAQGEGYLIRNVGAANPILVNGRTLAHGDTAALVPGELVRIGPYALQVALQVALQGASPVAQQVELPAAAAPAQPGPPLSPSRTAPAADPFADLLKSAAAPTASSPFADLLPPPSGLTPGSPAVANRPPPASRLPDDFDPFGIEPQARSAAAPGPAPMGLEQFDALAPAQGSAASLDALFGLGNTPGEGDAMARFMAGAAAPGPRTEAGVSTDPLALFGAAAAPQAAPAGPVQADNVSALHGSFALPGAAPPPTWVAPALPATAAAAAAKVADTADLWAAFCAGAGLTLPAAAPATAQQLHRQMHDQMHDCGRMLRSAVAGMLQLIEVRAQTKYELRAGVTVIQQSQNNPLKFSPDVDAALQQLLHPPLRGFMAGPAAVEDAMQDLVGHAIGSVAGLRSGVQGMLERFAPQALEVQLTQPSMLDNLLPAHRKARLWDLYLQHHGAIREEAQEDFHALFGKAFLAAYEEQVSRLKGGPR